MIIVQMKMKILRNMRVFNSNITRVGSLNSGDDSAGTLFTQESFSRYTTKKGYRRYTGFIMDAKLLQVKKLKDENHYSLENLCEYISDLYKNAPEIFTELTASQVDEIKKGIMDQTYTLSPLVLTNFPKRVVKPHDIRYVVDDNISHYFYLDTIPEDRLVLAGVSSLLINTYVNENIHIENPIRIHTLGRTYFDEICSRYNVSKLCILDLGWSKRTLNRERLLSKLEPIVQNRYILSLVDQFLNSSIQMIQENGRSIEEDDFPQVNIPYCGIISDILLDYSYLDFDKEFLRLFSDFDYFRFNNEVSIFLSDSQVKNFEIFEQQVYNLLDKLRLVGNLSSIEPGDAPVRFLCGHVSIDSDGEIQVH